MTRSGPNLAAESHSNFAKVKEDEFNKMDKLYNDKEKILGENDDTLSSKLTPKNEAETSKADDEDFLAKLQKMCAEKTKAHEDRKMVRANEEAAVAEAAAVAAADDSPNPDEHNRPPHPDEHNRTPHQSRPPQAGMLDYCMALIAS